MGDGALELTVEDARAATVTYSGLNVSLCALVAYGLENLLQLLADPNCTVAEPSTWPNPPDATTVDGADAWHVEAEYAATAVYFP
jgi:hypothetical protein